MTYRTSGFSLSYTSGLLLGICCFCAVNWYQVYQTHQESTLAHQAISARVGLTLQESAEELHDAADDQERRLNALLLEVTKAQYRINKRMLSEIREQIASTRARISQSTSTNLSLEE